MSSPPHTPWSAVLYLVCRINSAVDALNMAPNHAGSEVTTRLVGEHVATLDRLDLSPDQRDAVVAQLNTIIAGRQDRATEWVRPIQEYLQKLSAKPAAGQSTPATSPATATNGAVAPSAPLATAGR